MGDFGQTPRCRPIRLGAGQVFAAARIRSAWAVSASPPHQGPRLELHERRLEFRVGPSHVRKVPAEGLDGADRTKWGGVVAGLQLPHLLRVGALRVEARRLVATWEDRDIDRRSRWGLCAGGLRGWRAPSRHLGQLAFPGGFRIAECTWAARGNLNFTAYVRAPCEKTDLTADSRASAALGRTSGHLLRGILGRALRNASKARMCEHVHKCYDTRDHARAQTGRMISGTTAAPGGTALRHALRPGDATATSD